MCLPYLMTYLSSMYVVPSALYESADSEEEDSHSSEMTSYYLSCPWHYSTAGKLLFFASVGLIAIAVCACSCSIFSPEEREGPRREKVAWSCQKAVLSTVSLSSRFPLSWLVERFML